MTVLELYNQTKSIMFEKSSMKEFDPYVIQNTNMVISELFEQNNNLRLFKGKKPFRSIPHVESLEDELVYEDVYTTFVMPLGLARLFYINDDLQKFNLFNTDYKNEQMKHQCVVPEGRLRCNC